MKTKAAAGLALAATLVMAGVWGIVRRQAAGDPVMAAPVASTTRDRKVQMAKSVAPVSTAAPSFVTQRVAGSGQIAEIDTARAENERRMRDLENGLAVGDIPAALRFLQDQADTRAVRDLTVRLVRQWAESDVHAAANWAENVAAGDVRSEAINGVAIIWADQDLGAAVLWARQLPAGEEMDGVIKSVAYEASRTEPLMALDMAGDLPATPERDALVEHATLQWAAVSPLAAASWASEIPDAALRERVLANVATAWGESDPVSAAHLAVLLMARGKTQNDAVIGIVQRWAQKDPEAAMDWVRTFPEGELYEIAAENIHFLSPDPMP